MGDDKRDDDVPDDSGDAQELFNTTRLDTESKARSAEEFERRAREIQERDESRERENSE